MRDTLTQVLAGWSVLAAGIVAGTFFAVAVSVVPALATMPAPQYVRTQVLLGKGYHPVMPAVVSSLILADVLLAVLARGAGPHLLYLATAVVAVGVPAVSQWCNLPINKAVAAADSDGFGEDWQDPRARWRAWHLVRSVLAFAVLGLNTAGLAVVAGS
jgi:uncharacterized membrane protein